MNEIVFEVGAIIGKGYLGYDGVMLSLGNVSMSVRVRSVHQSNRQYRASSDGVYYQQQVPQYKNQPPPCTPVDTASYREGPHCQPPRRQYPLPQCYTNKSGFMCCNKRLESEMRTTFNQLKSSHKGTFQTCNTQKIANVMQENLQRSFNSTFETVAAIGDFASKIHFFSDHVCKLEIDGR
ncbi:unnamed protein product [Toxocara canis]|uniref:Ground-like domain-containing protein n=1 Tax=Toxocara canis TaxID=6265 RepID=A0A183UMA6_TOXCA|nr:unnamed protein product [Toxocara canis]